MIGLPRRLLLCLGVVLALVLTSAPVSACPFCSAQGQTLTGEVKQASMVLYGELANANQDTETTDLKIEEVIKDHPIRKDKGIFTIQRYVPMPPGKKYKFLVFFDVFKKKPDPYRGVAIKQGSDMAKYLKGAIEVKKAKAPIDKQLRFFFDYLDNEDIEISNDAYKEFAYADYKDYKGMAKDLPAEKILKWLKAEDTPSFRIGLYASMLGHCGQPEHADALRKLLKDRDRKLGSGVDGVLAAITMLQPEKGWKDIKEILADGKREFLFRYAALRAVRFLYQYRTDLVDKDDLARGTALLLSQNDIADLAIEDLRKWKRWEMTDRILALRNDKDFQVPIIERAILRFALSSPKKPAKEFVAQQRKKDPRSVADAEELLKLEETPTGG